MAETTHSKPRYPATLFRHRHRYGERYCGHCGRRLTPKIKTGGRKPILETVQAFAKRKYCDYSCRSRATMAARAALKVTAPPEPPALTDPAYGGPPAPVEIVEEVEPEPSKDAEKPSMAESGEPDPETWRPGELQAGTALTDLASKMRKDPALNRPVRPVKLPSATPPQRAPVPPPSLQARLPDPRPQTAPYTVTEGEVIERGDFGTCPTEGCGERLNAFGKCRNCEQRAQWLKGQRAKVGTA